MAPVLRHGLTLALVAALAAAAIGLVQFATRDRAVAARDAAEQRALLPLLPQLPGAALQLEEKPAPADPDLGWPQPRRVFIARSQGQPVAVILPVIAARGYGGAIHMLVGIDADGRIAGLRVVSHRETAGLGDRIEPGKSGWLRQFEQQSLQRTPAPRWTIKREQGAFDQLTGATVTSHAAIDALRQTLEYFAAHRDELMGKAGTEATHGH